MPLPKGLNDDEFALIRDALIMPAIEAFRPEAIVLQCGSDALADDPQSGLSLSNNALWDMVAAIKSRTSRLLVTGGGGYNPWSVGRAWTGVWATLNGHVIPDRLPEQGEAVLRALSWPNARRGRNPPEHWFTTLRDAPNHGPIRDVVRNRVAHLGARLTPWV